MVTKKSMFGVISQKLSALLVTALLIAACQPAASPAGQVAATAMPPPTPTSASSAEPAATATPTPTPVPLPPAPAATPSPPPTSASSAEPAATSTPAPTPVPPTATPSPTPATTAGATPLAATPLPTALRRGGYVIYFRHAATDRTQTDTDTQNLQNCQTQRNLNDQGRADAQAIGQAFQTLDIPVGQVLSSGFCRARDTAQLAFGQAEITPDLTGFPADLRAERIAALRRMLSTPPQPGTNTVLVAHGFNITNTAGVTIAEGEAAIFAPLGPDGFALVARVLPGEWAELE
jgi:broad specificity phosphatase PhoE